MKNELTLVTGLFNIGRGDLNGFGRSFDHYLECFARLLQTELPMVIYADEEVEEFVWKHRDYENTIVIRKTNDDIREQFPFYEKTNRIRQEEQWRTRAGWIPDSPQSQLDLYNPLVMSKQFFLNDAAIFDFFDTKYFVWIDGGITNTIGDPCDFFTFENSRKLVEHMTKMMYICYPYDGQVEVHGFEKQAFNRCAGTETTRVARGGMFGGSKDTIHEINDIYYQLLNDTLHHGHMGTEENINTLITYLHPEKCNVLNIENNGLIIKALNDVKHGTIVSETNKLATYTLVFNIPEQFEMWAESFKSNLPKEFEQCTKYVINNSTDESSRIRFEELFVKYDCTEIVGELQRKKEEKDGDRNVGICGGRQVAAEHFYASDHKYMVFFEDDMLLHGPNGGHCKSGMTTFHQKLFDKCMDIMEMEKLDFLKLSFSEFYGTNHLNWSWHNVPQEKKDEYFPDREDGVDKKALLVSHLGLHRGLSYAVGEYFYCNWPIMFTKEGTKKIFLDVRYPHLYEQTWMSHTLNLQREGVLKTGALLASPINHNRRHHYDGKIRRENEHYTN